MNNASMSNWNNEIQRVISTYSEADREKLSSGLLEVLNTSNIVKILDENQDSGLGTLRDVLQVCITLGKTDASLAWVVGVSNSGWSVRSRFRSFEISGLTKERSNILAMVLGRPGSLKKNPTSGQYLLNGEWKYASGWSYSSCFFCLAAVEGAATRDVRLVAVPSELLEVTEKWQSTGLRGTQSASVRAINIVIPECNMEDYSRILSGELRSYYKSNPGEYMTSYSGLFTGVLMNCLLGSILGATEAALDFVAAARTMPIAGSTYASMSDSGAIRAEIGRLRGNLDLYKRAAEYNADVIDKAAQDPSIILTDQERVENRGRATLVMRGCVDIVQDLLWIYGSSGLEKGCPLERIWRDVNVGARHGGFSKLIPEEAVGMAILGRNPKDITQMF